MERPIDEEILDAPGEGSELELTRRRLRLQTTFTDPGQRSIPAALRPLAEQVWQSRSILEHAQIERDGLQVVQETTWERAATFVLTAASRFWTVRQAVPPQPMMSADGDGGVDVVWRAGGRSLYLNIPQEPDSVVTFYGGDQANPDLRFQGEEDSTANGEWILGWLVR